MDSEAGERFGLGEGFRGRLQPATFAGRAEQMGMLDVALDRAERLREPQFVTLLGPLGVGKTRLWAEWLADLPRPGLRIARVALSAFGRGRVPGNLIGALLRQRFGIEPGFGPEAGLVQFRSELQSVLPDRREAEVAALLGRFLGFDLRESPLLHAIAATPEQARELGRAVLCRFLEQDARTQPLILAVDDLHLADAESLDVLEKLPDELGPCAVVVVATARHDLLARRPDWGRGARGWSRVDLGPLSVDDVGAVIRSVLGQGQKQGHEEDSHDPLPPTLLERAMVESGGNPYLLEQLLHGYTRGGVLVAEPERGWWFDPERADAAPSQLSGDQAAAARVASLSVVEREVLARGATFGSVFWTGGVVALGRAAAEPGDPVAVFRPDQSILDIRDILFDLAARDFLVRLFESSLPGDTEWAFKHPGDADLVLAGVDATALGESRRFAAQWLESRGGAGREARFEMLGRLYEGGADPRRASYCYLSAANDARRRAELDRARTLFLRGVRLMATDDAVAKMDALYALGDIESRLGRAPEALAHFREMLEIAWRLDLPAKGGAAHGRLARLNVMLGEHGTALGHLDVARRLFEAAGDLAGIASTLDDIGRVHLLEGAPEASLEFHRASFQVRDRLGDDRGKGLALARMGQVEHETGDLVAAEGHVRQAIELRRRAGDRQGMVASLLELGALERDLGRVERAMSILEEAWSLARELGERLFECSIAIALGDCWLTQSRPSEARSHFVDAREIARQFGAKLLQVEAARGLAEAELGLGHLLEARDEARAAFETALEIGAGPYAGAALRVAAASVGMGAPGDLDLGGAREMFDRAIELLSNTGSELELGRTLAAYAEFEERGGRKATARDLRRQANMIRDKTREGRASERASRARGMVPGALLGDVVELGA